MIVWLIESLKASLQQVSVKCVTFKPDWLVPCRSFWERKTDNSLYKTTFKNFRKEKNVWCVLVFVVSHVGFLEWS